VDHYDAGNINAADLERSVGDDLTAKNLPQTVRDKRGNVTTLVTTPPATSSSTDPRQGLDLHLRRPRQRPHRDQPLTQTTTRTYDTANRDGDERWARPDLDPRRRRAVPTEQNPLNQTTTYTYNSLAGS
jgi:hypothetical protein